MSKIKAMMKKCDILFSECIRLRDRNGTCITCGKDFRSVFTPDISCGHFQKRRHLNTRWNPSNAYGQCWKCNMHDDNLLLHKKIIEKVGEEEVNAIIRQSREEVHLSYLDLKEIYETLLKYKQTLKS